MNTLSNYEIPTDCLDEVFTGEYEVKEAYQGLSEILGAFTTHQFKSLNDNVKQSFLNQGITYQVYSNNATKEHIFPFDLFPRIITLKDWTKLEQGMIQRNRALNLFLEDIYGEQKILKDKVVPHEMIASSPHFCKEMVGFKPVGGVYCHISGNDIIKHNDDQFYVLEDNLRSPSGVSYVLTNREALKRNIGPLFKTKKVRTVDEYPLELLATMQSVAAQGVERPTCVLLTPGVYNSAYFEHAFLAQQMGIELVEGRDLFVEKDVVYMKTTQGSKKVDVIYRRIDDDFLDPKVFNKDSVLGVSGLMGAYLKGNVSLVNAPGTGVADDKAIYQYVPSIISYYLDEKPIIDNVKTYLCHEASDLKYVLENLEKLVVKPVDQSGGYGIAIGNKLTKAELSDLKVEIKNNPRSYVAQPILSLSLHSTFIDSENQFEPRHIDLRMFCLTGKEREYVLQGGLTRVALTKGSLIVNSSQGGGSKDTWVIEN